MKLLEDKTAPELIWNTVTLTQTEHVRNPCWMEFSVLWILTSDLRRTPLFHKFCSVSRGMALVFTRSNLLTPGTLGALNTLAVGRCTRALLVFGAQNRSAVK